MAGHLECIGIADESELVQFLERASKEGSAAELEHGGYELLWRDESGASIAANLSADMELECSRPSFDASFSVDVTATGFAEDPECRYCSRLLVEVLDGDLMVYPLSVELEEIGSAREHVAEGDKGRMAITAFAQSFEWWSDEDSYRAAPREGPPLAAESLIPTGMFPPDLGRRRLWRSRREHIPTAEALITGIVRSWEVRRNSVTSREFAHGLLDTFGATYDIVASLDDAPRSFAPGSIVQSECWLIGRHELSRT